MQKLDFEKMRKLAEELQELERREKAGEVVDREKFKEKLKEALDMTELRRWLEEGKRNMATVTTWRNQAEALSRLGSLMLFLAGAGIILFVLTGNHVFIQISWFGLISTILLIGYFLSYIGPRWKKAIDELPRS